MKICFLILAVLFSGLTVSAAQFNGKSDFLKFTWKPESGRAVFSVSFRLKVKAETLQLPKGAVNASLFPFHLASVPADFKGLQDIRMFFSLLPDPGKGYAGIQAAAWNKKTGKTSLARYNIYWRGANSTVPCDRFVQVVLAVGDGSFTVFIDGQNLAAVNPPKFLPLCETAPEYRLYFGMTPWRGGYGHLAGEIEDVALYEKILTADEVRNLSNGSSPGDIPGCAAWYPLNTELKNHCNKKADISLESKLSKSFHIKKQNK